MFRSLAFIHLKFSTMFNRLSGMDDDLFTSEVEVANIPCDSNMDDDSKQDADDDMGYDPFDVAFTEWLEETMKLSSLMKNLLTMKMEDAEVLRINANIFDYEMPLCLAFNEFNYLLKVDSDLLTKDIMGFKTYEDYKDDWIYEWNKNVPWVYDKPWLDNGIWKYQHQSNTIANLSIIRLDVWNGQPVVGERMVIVMEEICLVLTLLETRFITKTLNGFKMIKFSFGQTKSMFAMLKKMNRTFARNSEDACRDTREYFRNDGRECGKLELSRKEAEDKSNLKTSLLLVGIKRLLDDLRVTAAQVCVTAAKYKVKDMDQDSAHMVAASKVLMLKLVVGSCKKRFGGNAATKKTQRNLLKQQYENFTASSSEMLDQTFDILQNLVSQLELLDEKISQEDVNQ
ncbi:hypothetical protein Tco_1066106, partial [Tanacetum coccineum]